MHITGGRTVNIEIETYGNVAPEDRGHTKSITAIGLVLLLAAYRLWRNKDGLTEVLE